MSSKGVKYSVFVGGEISRSAARATEASSKKNGTLDAAPNLKTTVIATVESEPRRLRSGGPLPAADAKGLRERLVRNKIHFAEQRSYNAQASICKWGAALEGV